MSKPASAAAIGAFVVGAFLILFAALFLLSGNLFNRNVEYSLVVFDSSIKGLNVGAPVAFKGVPIGEVAGFDVVVDSDTYDVLTPVLLRIDRTRVRRTDENDRRDADINILVARGLRAQLQVQSLLTGLLYVQLDFHPGSEERFNAQEVHARYDVPEDYIIIPTIPTDLERLTRSLQEVDFVALADNVTHLVAGITRLANDEDLQDLPERAGAALAAIEQMALRLDQQLETVGPDLENMISDAAGTAKTLNQQVPALAAGTEQALAQLSATLTTAQQALANLEHLLSDDSAMLYDLRKAANELGAAGRSLQSLAETLETQPESLIRGKR